MKSRAVALVSYIVIMLALLSGCGSLRTAGIPNTADSVTVAGQEKAVQDQPIQDLTPQEQAAQYRFRNKKLLTQHYEKHGIDMGFGSAKEYEAAASAVVCNPDSLHKTEKEDGDDVYYLTATNEFVVVSTDGYIRTYFKPDSGLRYYNKQ
ncbi:MAG: hypothetical protein K6A71_01350 [Lachnospiraceae bacterium]|nr:hypothetical protein [Lachnospiraceae bacterium]